MTSIICSAILIATWLLLLLPPSMHAFAVFSRRTNQQYHHHHHHHHGHLPKTCSNNKNKNNKRSFNHGVVIFQSSVHGDDDDPNNTTPPRDEQTITEDESTSTIKATDGNTDRPNNNRVEQQIEEEEQTTLTLLSITELLSRLDERGIRYPPTATRGELESLLSLMLTNNDNHNNKDNLDAGKSDSPSTNSRSSTSRTEIDKSRPWSSSPSSSSASSSHLSITDLLQRLDARGVRYPPTATRSQLENLLELADVDEPEGRSDDVVQDHLRRRRSRRRQQQQQQQERRQNGRQVGAATAEQWKSVVGDKVSRTTDYVVRKARQVKRQAQELLEVDQDGVRDAHFKVVTSRQDSSTIQQPQDDKEEDKTRTIDVQVEPIRSRPPRKRRRGPRPPPSQRQEEGSTAPHPRRRRSRPPSSSPSSQYSYYSPDDTATYSTSRYAPDSLSRDRNPPPPRRRESWKVPSTYSNILPPADEDDSRFDPTDWQQQQQSRRSAQQRQYDYQRRRPRRPYPSANAAPRGTGKRIYSPYSGQDGPRNGYIDDDDDDDDDDPLDRLGMFMADMADKVMWGSYDDDNDKTPVDQYEPTRERRRNVDYSSNGRSRDAGQPSSGRRKRSTGQEQQHWKDRLEERFDSMLGIHQNGGYYSSWMDREQEERENEEGFDSFSVARGRRPKRRHKKVSPYRRRAKYNQPFWQDEGSLLSILFGPSNPASPMGSGSHRRRMRSLYDRILDGDSNGLLLNIFRATIHSSALFIRYVCQWASVRGALPQPVVVAGVAAAGLSARPGRRIRAVIIALLALRTIGEIVHGSMFGDEGFEDDEYDSSDTDFDDHSPEDSDRPSSSYKSKDGDDSENRDDHQSLASNENDEDDREANAKR